MKRTIRSQALLVAVSAVLAQAASAAEPEAENLISEVVVTATRIMREGFSAPTPTTIIGAAEIESRGVTNIIDIINEVPAFRPSQTQQAGSLGAGAGGSVVDLRGLGTTRTLVLVNGRRHVPTNNTGIVDLNLIPTSLIQRTEVVTGGASAAWGSDAVAGVVNLILKNDLEGLESNLAYGQSTHGDFEEYTASVAGGMGFAAGRGHIMAGMEYNDNKGTGLQGEARDWSRERWFQMNPSGAGRPPGTPSRVISSNVLFSDQLSPGGVIFGQAASPTNGNFNSLPLDNTIFLSGGGTSTFVAGSPLGGNLMVGGQNGGINLATGSYIVNPLKRYSGLTHISYELTDNLHAFFEGSLGYSEFTGLGPQRRDQANLRIYGGNPFLLAAAPGNASIAGMTSTQSFLMGRLLEEYGHYRLRTEQQTLRGVVGLEGKFGGNWQWDAYYQRGENQTDVHNYNTLQANFFAATDAVLDANNNVVCRSETAAGYRGPTIYGGGPAAGCVPINIFGAGSPSPAALAYVSGLQTNVIRLTQDAAAFNISGEPFSSWAGPISIASGLEYRKDTVSANPDANSRAARFESGNPQPTLGNVNIKEVYVETLVPLASDKFLLKSLDLNAAARRTDYSTSGLVTTWKAGLTYEPHADVRLRATQSRDIRAPNLNELFAGAFTAYNNARNPANNITGLTPVLTLSNPNLQPEEADTFTAGIVLTPSLLPGLRLSVDYYDIQIDKVITTLSGQMVVDRCFTPAGSSTPGNAPQGNAFCSQITFGAPAAGVSPILIIRTQQLNLSALDTDGVDIELSYNLPSLFGLPGGANLRLLGTYVDSLVTIDSVSRIDRAKQTVPQWVWNFGFTYTLDRFSGNVQVRHLGPTIRDVTLVGPDRPDYNPAASNSINDNTVPSIDYVSLSGQYKFIERDNLKMTVYGVINNLLDRDPPDGTANNAIGPTLYDLVGRTYRLGVRVNL